jgi:hypothetical protein
MSEHEQEQEQVNAEIREDIRGIKEQISKMFEAFQKAMRDEEERDAAVRTEPTPDFPPGFFPPPEQAQGTRPQSIVMPLTIYPNTSSQQASQPREVQIPPYGLPLGYTPPFASGPTDSNPPATVQASFVQTQGALT